MFICNCWGARITPAYQVGVTPVLPQNDRTVNSKKLTKQVVDGLPITAKDHVIWCGKLPGFGCRIRPSGHKTFIVMYRVGGRNAALQKVTIGAYGKITVEEARVEAVKILAKAELGEDVGAERARVRAEMTLSQLCSEYLDQGVENKKASTLATDRSRISRHIIPLLGKKRIGEVKQADVSRFLRDIATGRTARDVKTIKHGRSIVKGGKGAATRTVRLLGGIFTYAIRRGYLKENPCKRVELYKDGSGERFLSIAEFQQLAHALRVAETDGLPFNFRAEGKSKHRSSKLENQREIISPHVTAAIRLLILTGCRLREVLQLKWSEIDFDRALLNLSDSKTGKKTVLLATPAMS